MTHPHPTRRPLQTLDGLFARFDAELEALPWNAQHERVSAREGLIRLGEHLSGALLDREG
jgi:hypothetical protein